MRITKIAVFLMAVAALAIAPACGGGGRGLRGSTTPLTLETNALPSLLSGESIEYELPIGGGCGGPYILNLIAGRLPDGISLDDREANTGGPGIPAEHRHHITGIALEDGPFVGTVEVVDTACTPFQSMRFDFQWEIGRGPIKVVGASPALVPVADVKNPLKYTDVDAIAPVIFNQFSSINLVVAGGVAPYSCNVIDDPADPDDGQLPLGTSMPPSSCSIVGAPVAVGPNGRPFRLTIRATDSVGNTTIRKFQWEIRTPPIVFGTQVISDGIAGQNYGEIFQIADGVPPFAFEFTGSLPTINDNTDDSWSFFGGTNPPTIPGVTVSNLGPADDRLDGTGYPSETAPGPYTSHPPEGLTLSNLGTQAGTFQGFPRRIGDFTVIVHAYSALVPNENGQHGWRQFSFSIADSESAPIVPFGINPNTFVEGVLNTGSGDTYPNVPEFAVTTVYNPDSSSHPPLGLQMLGTGGVSFDGRIDSPHTHLADTTAINLTDSDEVFGNYVWEVLDWDATNLGVGQPATIRLFDAPSGGDTAGFSDGVLNTDDPNALQTQSRQIVEFAMYDQQLPLATRHAAIQRAGLAVGPDTVIITESTTSSTITSGTNGSDIGMHDDQLMIRKLQIIGGSPVISALNQVTDMAKTHVMPADANLTGTNPLGTLLSRFGAPAAPTTLRDPNSLDLMRVVVNVSGWWDSSSNLNPKAANHMSHTSSERGRAWGDASSTGPGFQPTAAAVALPDSATHSPGSGIYGTGGKLYAFEKDSHFGIMVIREDSKIYIPYASDKGTFTGFGDGMFMERGANQADRSHSALRTVQMAVSPNGQYAAIKLKVNALNLAEAATSSRVVIFSLDGSKPFGGQTYKIIQTGAVGSLNGVLYATSMVMTDKHLYYLIGEDYTSFPYASWQDHFIMKYEILGSDTSAAEATGNTGNWTQDGSIGLAMQTPFHHYDRPIQTVNVFVGAPVNGFATIDATNNERYLYDGWNMTENSIAPIPFRVSADGTTCALLAGPTTTSSSGSLVWQYYAWVDQGSGFRQASSTTRKARAGASRAHVLRRGSNSYRHWGNYEGPSGGFEVSDDGNKIAFTFSTSTSVSSTFSGTSNNLGNSRQDMMAIETSDGWLNFTEHDVTADFFGTGPIWRFGSLTFGKDDKLYYWGGHSRRGSSTSDSTTTSTTAAYPQWAAQQAGTFYVFDFDSATETKSVLAASAGGTGFNTFTATSKVAGTTTPGQQTGLIIPVAGFVSKSRDFLYIDTFAPLSATDGTTNRLIGVNISGTTINGHLADRGFAVGNWPKRRGFMPASQWGPHQPISARFYSPGKSTASTEQVMAKDTGYVYFASHNQFRSARNDTSTTSNFTSGPFHPAAWADEGAYDGHIEAFHADVGGDIRRLTQPGLSDPTPNASNGTTLQTQSRAIFYLEASRDGTRLAYQFHSGRTIKRHDQEGIGYISQIKFNADGSLGSSFVPADHAILLEGSGSSGSGRAGPNMAFDSTGTKLFYAFGAGDENAKGIFEVEVKADLSVNKLQAGAGKRFSVLHAGR